MKNLVKKLSLGTVQFGLDYGINNPSGRPSREKSLAMLDFAYEKGIRVFDTAGAYGKAEEILGEFCQSRNLNGKIRITTKLKFNTAPIARGAIVDIIADEFKKSLKRLKSDYLDGCLLHEPEQIREGNIVRALSNLKKQGLIKNIGVSIYEDADAIYAAKLKEVDYIQVPYNVFNQRLNRTDFFQLAKKNDKTVFARSVFSQGLFFMPEDKIPPQLEGAKIYLRDFDKIIDKYGLTRIQAALFFALGNNDIDYAVFGVDNIKQLAEIVNLVKQPPDYQACVNELKDKFIKKDIISSNLWPR